MNVLGTESARGRERAVVGGWLGDSEMAGMVRAFDWSKTTLGPIERWPPGLASAIGLCLHSRFQGAVYAGPDLLMDA